MDLTAFGFSSRRARSESSSSGTEPGCFSPGCPIVLALISECDKCAVRKVALGESKLKMLIHSRVGSGRPPPPCHWNGVSVLCGDDSRGTLFPSSLLPFQPRYTDSFESTDTHESPRPTISLDTRSDLLVIYASGRRLESEGRRRTIAHSHGPHLSFQHIIAYLIFPSCHSNGHRLHDGPRWSILKILSHPLQLCQTLPAKPIDDPIRHLR